MSPLPVSLPPAIACLGEVMQMAFVSRDFDDAMNFWSGNVGAGPFFVIDHVRFDQISYRGAFSDIDLAVGIAYWGSIQIECVYQHNDAPSIFLPWQKDGRGGLHHLGMLVDDLGVAADACCRAGAVIEIEGKMPRERGNFFYASLGENAPYLEIIEPGAGLVESFAFMRDASRHWDGSDPIRRSRSGGGG